MSWTTDNALNRIVNVYKRFKEQKGKLWDKDIEAIQTLSTEIENSQKTYVNDNILYAKLLSHILKQNLAHYGSMPMAIKATSDILNTPINEHIEWLRLELNNQDDINFFKGLDLEIDHLNHKENNNDKILTDNQKEIKEKFGKFWNYEKVSSSFYKSANEFLKDINNYK